MSRSRKKSSLARRDDEVARLLLQNKTGEDFLHPLAVIHLFQRLHQVLHPGESWAERWTHDSSDDD
jgi:hypothetical protein